MPPKSPYHKREEVDLSVERLWRLKENVLRAPGYARDFEDSAPYTVYTPEGYIGRWSNLQAAIATLIHHGRGLADRTGFLVRHKPSGQSWDWAACLSEAGRRRVA